MEYMSVRCASGASPQVRAETETQHAAVVVVPGGVKQTRSMMAYAACLHDQTAVSVGQTLSVVADNGVWTTDDSSSGCTAGDVLVRHDTSGDTVGYLAESAARALSEPLTRGAVVARATVMSWRFAVTLDNIRTTAITLLIAVDNVSLPADYFSGAFSLQVAVATNFSASVARKIADYDSSSTPAADAVTRMSDAPAAALGVQAPSPSRSRVLPESFSRAGPRADTQSLEQVIGELYDKMAPGVELPQTEPPFAVTTRMFAHQKQALGWLARREQAPNNGGIYSDQMGLGKTLVMLALISASKSRSLQSGTSFDFDFDTDGPAVATPQRGSCSPVSESPKQADQKTEYGPTLVVTPYSLLTVWADQIAKHFYPRALKYIVFHAPGRSVTCEQIAETDIVFTTYGILASEFRTSLDRADAEPDGATDKTDESPGSCASDRQSVGSVLYETRWHRVVLDEAHMIKNFSTRTARAACALRTDRRWCVTGTPVQNSIYDLYSLLKFIRIEPVCDKAVWDSNIAAPMSVCDPRALARLQRIVAAVCLRRTKDAVEDVIKLPAKSEVIEYVTLSDKERHVYSGIETSSSTYFNELVSRDAVLSNWAGILVLLLRLRQACCHTALLPQNIPASASSPQPMLAGPSRIVAAAQALEADVAVCTACGAHVDADSTLVSDCFHIFCRRCFALVAADTPVSGSRTSSSASLPFGLVPWLTQRQSLDSVTRLSEQKLVLGVRTESKEPNGKQSVAVAGLPTSHLATATSAAAATADEMTTVYTLGRGCPECRQSLDQGMTVDDFLRTFYRPLVLHETPIDKTADEDALPHKMRHGRQMTATSRAAHEGSAKIDALVRIMERVRQDDPSVNFVVFSQWVCFMDLIKMALEERLGEQCLVLNGKLSSAERATTIASFQATPDDNISDESPTEDGEKVNRGRTLLCSLRAGGVGLTLTAASHVVIMDPWWNPAVEEQAMDRVHRIGQRRDVTVHRIIARDTIEENLLRLQNAKELLSGSLFGKRSSDEAKAARLRVLNILLLRQGGAPDSPSVASSSSLPVIKGPAWGPQAVAMSAALVQTTGSAAGQPVWPDASQPPRKIPRFASRKPHFV